MDLKRTRLNLRGRPFVQRFRMGDWVFVVWFFLISSCWGNGCGNMLCKGIPCGEGCSLRPPILRCSFKHTDRTCLFHSITIRLRERYIAEIQEAPRKRTIERATFGLNCYQNCYQLGFLFAFLFSAEQYQDFLHNLFL